MSGFLFLVIILGVALLTLMVISQSKPTRKSARGNSSSAGPIDREFVERKWETIEQLTKQGGSGLRDAVSEADKLLDYALKHSGVRGETMGERLRHAGSRFSDINGIWRAHKLRNVLAHEADFDVVPSQAKEAIASFRTGLKDLGAL